MDYNINTDKVWNSDTGSFNLIKLSILIATIPSRKEMFDSLVEKLRSQYTGTEVEMFSSCSITESIGAKRNSLLELANGEYVCFIDDDDTISSTYIQDIMEGLKQNPDCLSLRGVITWDGANPEIFEHSVRYNSYVTHTLPVNGIKYERYPNHLNVIKASIAKQFKFPELNHGEDSDWATQIKNSGLLKNEVYIDKVLYHYQFVPNK